VNSLFANESEFVNIEMHLARSGFVSRKNHPVARRRRSGHGQHAVSDLHLGDLASDSDHFARKVAARDKRIFDPGELSVSRFPSAIFRTRISFFWASKETEVRINFLSLRANDLSLAFRIWTFPKRNQPADARTKQRKYQAL
jgi:hypothetical protein